MLFISPNLIGSDPKNEHLKFEPAFPDTYTNNTFPTYINRKIGQRNLFLIYTPALVDRYEIGRNAKLLLTLQSKNPGAALIRPGSGGL